MRTLFTISLLSFLLFGCFSFDEGNEEAIIGKYYARSNDGSTKFHLGFEDEEFGGIGIIEESIISIGHNKEFIIVKIKSDNTEYYIVRVMESGLYSEARKNIIGPLQESGFDSKLKELKIEEIKWTKNFKK